jgi:AcrR family transcriptional regulator
MRLAHNARWPRDEDAMPRPKTEEPKTREPEKDARSRILDAAAKIFLKEGVRGLTQTRVAAEAGVRQSHLTYYFPKKSDLLAAALRETHRQAERSDNVMRGADGFDAALRGVATLMFDSAHMRSFLALVVEASEAEETRKIVEEHARCLAAEIAPLFGREANDPDVAAFIDLLRGMGLRALLTTEQPEARMDLEAIAKRFGLLRVEAA